MAKVRLSAAARRDLAKIDDWSVRQFGQDVTGAYADGFRGIFRLLADHLEAGPDRSEVSGGLRSFRHRSHILFYRIEQDVVEIVRVLHHAQDARRILRQ
jgi:toxin ParE1/3/4